MTINRTAVTAAASRLAEIAVELDDLDAEISRLERDLDHRRRRKTHLYADQTENAALLLASLGVGDPPSQALVGSYAVSFSGEQP